jgi:hypothetical protein
MGKTALLRQCVAETQKAGGLTITAEADAQLRLTDVVSRELRAALSATESLPKRLVAALSRMVQHLPKISYELPHDAGAFAFEGDANVVDEPQPADALEDLLFTLSQQLRGNDRFLCIAIDEIQESARTDLLRIIRTVHRTAGTEHPILLLGAGLPNSAAVLKAARTYTERYAYLNLDFLSRAATLEAIDVPARRSGVHWQPDAADALYSHSRGYPYFIQEYASAAWLAHGGAVITAADVETIASGVRTLLDEGLYSRQFAQLSPREAVYVLALAGLGPGVHHSEEIARALNVRSAELGSVRAALIKRDIVFAPARALTEFRLPLTNDYIDRHREPLEKRASLGRNNLTDNQ